MENPITSKLEWLKWLGVALLVAAGIAANFYYNQQPWPLRLLVGLVLTGVILFAASQTVRGKQFLSFAYESRIELRKVVWPTRQETMQTTLVIAAMVIVLALMLWGIDGVLMWLIGWLTGQRG
ncbi:MAG: preprotein translocase subunit SecE [Gammaproteobacteria bacterium]|nr:preprotein translocase subunit SecE [Gammaproteobacteria bacterium]